LKIISVAAVTAGGKATLVNELKKHLKNVRSLHFDDYTFRGEVDNFYEWVMQGADYNVYDLSPLINDICEIRKSSDCDYLILDYPFAYCHDEMSKYIDYAIFIDTPLDIAMARRVLRDMKDSSADEIRFDMEMYLKYARVAYVQMLKDVLPSSDYVIDGTKGLEEMAEELKKVITAL